MNVQSNRAAFGAGVRAVSPTLIGIAPFGVIAGALAVEQGFAGAWGVAFSLLIFAGASQIAALEMLGTSAPLLVIIGTALVINARFFMCSAGLAPYFAPEPLWRRLLGGYLLTDQSFAISVSRYNQQPTTPRWPYYLGTATALWLVWQLGTLAGAVLGNAVPESIPLAFAIPLTFLALLMPTLADRPSLLAALVAAAVTVGAGGLPLHLSLPVGSIVGALTGAVAARRIAARGERTPKELA